MLTLQHYRLKVDALNNTFEISVSEQSIGLRLDRFLSDQLPEVSRSQIQRWLLMGAIVSKSGCTPEADYKVQRQDVFIITPPPAVDAIPQPQKHIAINIIYEDDDIIVINKPAGMVVHPAPGHHDNTLVNALLGHCGESLSGIGGVKRPGIVHRLDKDTSGLMVVAKNDIAHHGLSAQFANNRTIHRTYIAYIWGTPNPIKGIIDAPIARHSKNRQLMAVRKISTAKKAVTHYQLVNKWILHDGKNTVSKIECLLETGRTHQIRVHSQYMGHPIMGDPVYGRKNIPKTLPDFVRDFPRQALHACKLSFVHPITQKSMNFEIQLPQDLKNLEDCLYTVSS